MVLKRKRTGEITATDGSKRRKRTVENTATEGTKKERDRGDYCHRWFYSKRRKRTRGTDGTRFK